MTEVGDSIGGYRIQRLLRVDDTGTTYVVDDPVVDGILLLKFLPGTIATSDLADRFAREARLVESLHHPNIARTYDWGVHDSQPYVVVPYVEGDTLADVIEQTAHHTVSAKLRWMTQLCSAVAYANALGLLVHGDIRPSMLVVNASGNLIVLDFGTGRLRQVTAARANVTREELAYKSPEQILGGHVDGRSDVFSIGAVCYALLASKEPFASDTIETVTNRILNEEPFSLEDLPDISDVLAGSVMKALKKDPDARFSSAAALGDALNAPAMGLPPMGWGHREEPSSSSSGQAAIAAEELPVHDSQAHRIVDENVQFTVFRPKLVVAGVWHTMLVFAHLSEASDDSFIDPIEELQRQARSVLGELDAHGQQTVDSLKPVPLDGELTLVPRADGVEFNPPARSFRWIESVHREEFRLRAHDTDRAGIVRGRLSIYLGAIIVAEVALTLKIDPSAKSRAGETQRQTVRPYRKIFASYSHRDSAIVAEFSEYARAMGDRYLRDVVDLRAGERWHPALAALIEQADVFQLFWSWNALRSQHVRDEWQHALALPRRSFIRPVYWDEPMPEEGNLPPSALRALHFERIRPLHSARAERHSQPALSADPVEFADNPEPKCPCVLLVDTSERMSGARIDAVSEGLIELQDHLLKDPLASRRVEIAIVTFSRGVRLVQPFVTVDRWKPPHLHAAGQRQMSAGIERALRMTEHRRKGYIEEGISYFRPWIFMITSGLPEGESEEIRQRVAQHLRQLESEKRVAVFAVAFGGADIGGLSELVVREPVTLDLEKVSEMFAWLSSSLEVLVRSDDGGEIRLPLGWGHVSP